MVMIDTETDQIEFFATTLNGHIAAIEPGRLDRGFGAILDAGYHTEARTEPRSATG
jgi:hypothetical protein